MKITILAFLACFLCSTAGAQSNTWTAFYNSDTTLTGYKDKDGKVMIEPKFSGFSGAYRFDDIIAVMEESEGKWESYYLAKSGKIAGRDSLFSFDNAPDCESEGFIRFHDRKSDKMGLFNRHGEVALPAHYNSLTRVTNGMVMALANAEKKYWDTTGHSGCNHFSWVGGKQMLLDTAGNVLVEDFRNGHGLDFYSVKKSDRPQADTIYQNYRTKDGSYLSFINMEKEFSTWLKKDLLPGLTAKSLLAVSYDTITWWSQDGWVRTNKSAFVNKNFELLKKALLDVGKPGVEYFISDDGLNQFMYEGPEFEKYYNNCGEPKQWIYPVMSIVVSYYDKKEIRQNHFGFLRTDEGYKLIEVTMRSEK